MNAPNNTQDAMAAFSPATGSGTVEFRADDVRDNMPLFRSGLGGSTPTSALQLKIRIVNVHRAIELNKTWHSRLPNVDWSNIVRASPSLCFVAEHNDIAYASAIWSAPCARGYNGRNWLELRRLAIAGDAPKNTATRMLRVMRLMIVKCLPQISKLISYQDTEVHAGTIYRAAGWVAIETFKKTRWHIGRERTQPVSVKPKIRWEYSLRESPNGAACAVAGAKPLPSAPGAGSAPGRG